MNLLVVYNVKEVTVSDEPTQNDHHLEFPSALADALVSLGSWLWLYDL